jgi:hypothetical protein
MRYASPININTEVGKANITYEFLVNTVWLWRTGHVAGINNIRNAYRISGGEALESGPYERPRNGIMIWTFVIRDLI